MDNLRGQDEIESDDGLDQGAIEAPPSIFSNERRMHVRAYNYWVSLLGSRALPSIEDLNPEEMEDFSANSVLLDFSMGMDNPAIIYLGSALREECGIEGPIERVSEVPHRSLLTRLTDHYLQIIANAAPVGFEAEFTNQRDAEIMYRGILMPFSSDDETIDFIYGVISWKEVASPKLVEGLGEEMKNAMDAAHAPYPATPIWADGPSATVDFEDEDTLELDESAKLDAVTDFGFDEILDEPAELAADDVLDLSEVAIAPEDSPRFYTEIPLDIIDAAAGDLVGGEADPQSADAGPGAEVELVEDTAPGDVAEDAGLADLDDLLAMFNEAGEAAPTAGSDEADRVSTETDLADELDLTEFAAEADVDPAPEPVFISGDDAEASDSYASSFEAPSLVPVELEEEAAELAIVEEDAPTLDEGMSALLEIPGQEEPGGNLADMLDMARQGASEARDSDVRSRGALYRAVGLAYDFALSAYDSPEDYVLMLENAGITTQERSPMTPVVKLVFGADYEKTRLAEYALALDYAFAQKLPRGGLAPQLSAYEGGLKGLVRDMREARRTGPADPGARAMRRLDRAVRRLNKADPAATSELPFGDLGLAVVIARREADGTVSLLAGVGLEDKAAQKVMIAASKKI